MQRHRQFEHRVFNCCLYFQKEQNQFGGADKVIHQSGQKMVNDKNPCREEGLVRVTECRIQAWVKDHKHLQGNPHNNHPKNKTTSIGGGFDKMGFER